MVTADISGDLVCGGASDGSCTVWSVKTCREKARLTGHQQKVRIRRVRKLGLILDLGVTASTPETVAAETVAAEPTKIFKAVTASLRYYSVLFCIY